MRHLFLTLTFLVFAAPAAFAQAPAPGGSAEVCNDSIDNDSDGDIDCADSDCKADPACVTAALPAPALAPVAAAPPAAAPGASASAAPCPSCPPAKAKESRWLNVKTPNPSAKRIARLTEVQAAYPSTNRVSLTNGNLEPVYPGGSVKDVAGTPKGADVRFSQTFNAFIDEGLWLSLQRANVASRQVKLLRAELLELREKGTVDQTQFETLDGNLRQAISDGDAEVIKTMTKRIGLLAARVVSLEDEFESDGRVTKLEKRVTTLEEDKTSSIIALGFNGTLDLGPSVKYDDSKDVTRYARASSMGGGVSWLVGANTKKGLSAFSGSVIGGYNQGALLSVRSGFLNTFDCKKGWSLGFDLGAVAELGGIGSSESATFWAAGGSVGFVAIKRLEGAAFFARVPLEVKAVGHDGGTAGPSVSVAPQIGFLFGPTLRK